MRVRTAPGTKWSNLRSADAGGTEQTGVTVLKSLFAGAVMAVMFVGTNGASA